jgi:hypothetical protein
VQRFSAAALLVAAAIVLWLATFYASAYALVWLVEAVEGDTSECWSSQCGTLGELIDDHDLLGVVLLAFLAALPAAALLWKARARLADRDAEASY